MMYANSWVYTHLELKLAIGGHQSGRRGRISLVKKGKVMGKKAHPGSLKVGWGEEVVEQIKGD